MGAWAGGSVRTGGRGSRLTNQNSRDIQPVV